MGASAMNNEAIDVGVLLGAKYITLFFIPFVEPQIAGILGGIAYLIIRHEAKIEVITFRKFFVVMFFGWLGAWAVVNILNEHYTNCPHVWEHILSASVGFMMYDALLLLGTNTKSVVGFFGNIIKSIVEKGVEKLWK